jgi:hypothetical protein
MAATPELRARFEELLTEPLQTTSSLKRAVRHAGGTGPATVSVSVLLDGLARKTSPLHLRMAHAIARAHLEGAEDTVGIVVICNEIAHMIRRPDLGQPVPQRGS